MIIKANNKLYNCNDWKTLYQEDDFACIKYFKTHKNDDQELEFFEHVIELIDDDYYFGLQYKHNDWDHKDIRQVKYIAEDKAYKILMDEILAKKDFIDLDQLLDQEKLCNEAEKEYIKSWED